MFSGYHFFDYKYNIAGYSGQDYNGFGRILYIIIAFIAITALLISFRKASKETIHKYLKISSIVAISMYVIKTTWESIYDIRSSGEFNTGLLPFDTCSIIMWATLMAAYGKGRVKELGECWIVTGGIIGGMMTIPFLNALKYYPFFTFGAFYSMAWHIFMTFTGLFLLVTNYVECSFKTVLKGFILHMIISVPVIIFNYIKDMDFMLYYYAGGIPFIEDLSNKLAESGLRWITTLVMIPLYFAGFNAVIWATYGIKKFIRTISQNKIRRETQPINEN